MSIGVPSSSTTTEKGSTTVRVPTSAVKKGGARSNLKRTIMIASDEVSFASSDLVGGHMIIRGEESAGYIDNVEFMRVGQAGELGRQVQYHKEMLAIPPLSILTTVIMLPFYHWHMAGDVHGQYFRHSSVHDSYQRCVVVHRSNFATIEGNTGYKHVGHGFFLEDGHEVKNIIIGNLGVLSKRPSSAHALVQSDITGDIFRFAPTAAFWISHPDNVVERNVAAGSEGECLPLNICARTYDSMESRATTGELCCSILGALEIAAKVHHL